MRDACASSNSCWGRRSTRWRRQLERRMRVLIVEDNEMNRDMLVRRLRRHGFDVCVAIDGAAALREVQSCEPDVILMDISLPVYDGLEVTRRLKADPRTRAIPVIALTAHAFAEDP